MKNNKRNQGFAVGVILLAVVLMAAIAAALSSGSSTSSAVTTKESQRIVASSLISQGTNIKGDLDLAKSDGYTTFRLLTTHADCPGSAFCLYNTTNGYGAIPQVQEAVGSSDAAWVWGNVRILFGGADLGTSAADEVIVVYGVNRAICEQINSILNGDKPDVYENDSDGAGPLLGSDLDSSAGMTAGYGITVDNTYRGGCFIDDGGSSSAQTDYTYVDIVDIN